MCALLLLAEAMIAVVFLIFNYFIFIIILLLLLPEWGDWAAAKTSKSRRIEQKKFFWLSKNWNLTLYCSWWRRRGGLCVIEIIRQIIWWMCFITHVGCCLDFWFEKCMKNSLYYYAMIIISVCKSNLQYTQKISSESDQPSSTNSFDS